MLATLREATPADEAAVLALLDEADLETEFLAEEFLVAEQEGRVVACGRMKPLADGTHELASVAVAPSLQGSGVGTQLTGALLARVATPVVALALAPGFFARFGFAPVDEMPATLREKAEGVCASRGFVTMRREPTPRAQVATPAS